MKINFVFTLVLGLVFLISISGVQAFSEGYCVDVQVTDINPTSVELDSEVTVGIQFDNCGDEIPEIINFEIRRFSEDIKIKEPLIINFTESFGYSNSNRFNVYHLYVSKDATPGEYVFEYKLTYGNKDFQITKEDNFSITVIGNEADLNIALVKTDPVIPEVGEEMTLTIRIENFGKGDANSVKAKVDLPFFGTKEAFLGNLETEDDSPAIFTLVPDKSGSFNYNIDITYKDDYGEHKITEKLELNVQSKDKNWFLIFGALLLIILGIIYFYFKRRKKNEQKRS
jgi:LPXTG-motif cell wall-anchored protein